jgi:hypothetical protein
MRATAINGILFGEGKHAATCLCKKITKLGAENSHTKVSQLTIQSGEFLFIFLFNHKLHN